jgi:hypothetical protein
MTRIVDTSVDIYNNGWFYIHWEDDMGFFGEIKMQKTKDGTFEIYSETMGAEFIKKVLAKMVDMAKILE